MYGFFHIASVFITHTLEFTDHIESHKIFNCILDLYGSDKLSRSRNILKFPSIISPE